mmetsp:Transcript_20190/g.56241  ORF Transcript_20190/g.56241 Transcript_20190/m.56241 type:complete len:227 (-) Transcript_20190:1679-2359(-)
MAPQTASCPCCGCSTTLHGMWTRVAASARALSPSTWSPGTVTSLTGWTCARTMARKRPVPETCSMACGSMTCSCAVWRPTASGPCSVPMRLRAWQTAGERSLTSCTRSMRAWGVHAGWYVPSSCGSPSWRPRSRLATLTCCSRTAATASPTSRTWAPSSAPTCALRSLSTPALRRRLCATWHPLRCHALCAKRTWTQCVSPRSSSAPWTLRTGSLTLRSWQRSLPA